MTTRTQLEAGRPTPEDLWTIRRSALFGRLPDEAFRRLFEDQPVRAVPKHTILCQWGEAAECCFILIEGLVKVFRVGEEESEVVLAIHGAGRALMLAEGLIGRPYSASAETIGPARIMCLNAHMLREQIGADGKLSMALLASAASHLRMLVAHVEELKTMTGPARLADMILNLAGTRTGSAQVSLPYEKQLIAGRLGITPESFSRAIGQLKAHGVSVSRDKLLIKDVARLRNFAVSAR